MLPLHVRMARAALGWTAQELAERAKINLNTVSRFESGREVKSGTLARIETAFAAAGIVLIDEDIQGGPGVRLTRDLAHRMRSAPSTVKTSKSAKRSQKNK